MKQMLYTLNITDEEGRLNFVHAIIIGLFINLIVSGSVESCYLLLSSFALLAWKWKVQPPRGRKASIDDIESYRHEAKEALDQIKKLNLKLGFRS
jgi:hypothetical protein